MKFASPSTAVRSLGLGLAVLLLGACDSEDRTVPPLGDDRTAPALGGGDALPAPGRPIVIAHRGASGLAPEHTVASFDRAVAIGADYLEQDLQLTRDGVLVVLHDETLDRTARGPAPDCTGPVRARTLAQLKTCDFGAWFAERSPETGERFTGQGILTLDALFRRYGRRARYYIETKQPEEAPGMEEALLALLEEHDLLPKSAGDVEVLIQSFSPASLRKIHGLRPDLPLVLLLERGALEPSDSAAFAVVAAYAAGIAPHHGDVDAPLVGEARRHGLWVHPYTVNDEGEMGRLLDLDVDGMFTDHPEKLVAVRSSRQR